MSPPKRRRRQAAPDKRVIVGLSGGSGAAIAVRLLEELQKLKYESHLVVTPTGRQVTTHETGLKPAEVDALATHHYRPDNMFAPIASGSFETAGMVIAPCSMKTLAGIAHGYSDNLMLRAADVCLKERRRLVLVTREAPYGLVHIENMRRATLAGAIVLPAVLTLYSNAETIEDMVDHLVGKALDLLGIANDMYTRWGDE